MKKILIGISGCLILLVGVPVAGHLSKTATSTGHPHDLKAAIAKTVKSYYMEKLLAELKKKGYNTAQPVAFVQGRKRSEVTIDISASEYKGQQTENAIENCE